MNMFTPEVVDAKYRGDYRIHLTFNDGTEGVVDFARWVGRGPVFEPLKDPAYFQRFFIDVETVEWPNGADIAPETLYEAARASGVTARKLARRSKPAAKKRSRRAS